MHDVISALVSTERYRICGNDIYSGIESAFIVWLLQCGSWYTVFLTAWQVTFMKESRILMCFLN
jgi:hypothetical protein